ncbi:unnamed protein product [Arabidopsis thaliana]|uniref:(thale cress) hypothetical protein n=1 Tax=Arabidopsis thaliana TaxID=3702 RepID=A0A7G2E2V8_ARATH|nr:unnamed protein product [Arabidopsis thaliana]
MSETMDHFDTKQDQLFEQILMPDTTNTVRSHGKKFQVTVEKKPLGSWKWNNLFKAKSQVGDAYNQIWVVKPEEKMKLLKNTKDQGT